MNEISQNARNLVTTSHAMEIIRRSANALAENPALANVIPPIMLRGAAGIGKSSIVKDIADSLGIGFVDVRLAQMERVDFAGLPRVSPDGMTEWCVPKFWPREMNSRGIILLDEITSAPSDVQVAAYSLVLDRKIPNTDYVLPDGWLIVAAGNRAEDRAVVKAMSSALANRFAHYEVEVNPQEWNNWAIAHDTHPSVTGFIKFRPNYLHYLEKQDLERGFPTPRSWAKVSSLISIYGDDDDLMREAVFGCIGAKVGAEFMAFYKLNKRFDDVLEMMVNPKAKIVIPSRGDEKHAFTSAVSYLLWQGENKKDQTARINGLFRIVEALDEAYGMLLVKSAMLGNSKIQPAEAAIMITENKNYAKFTAKYQAKAKAAKRSI